MSLFKKSSLTFTRYGKEEDDDYGRPKPTIISPSINTKGSLQPLPFGEKTKVLPEGKKTRDAYVYYTKTKLNMLDVAQSIPSDTTVIDGRVFEVFDYGDWAKVASRLVHNQYLLVCREA